jgi:hypothetical protein
LACFTFLLLGIDHVTLVFSFLTSFIVFIHSLFRRIAKLVQGRLILRRIYVIPVYLSVHLKLVLYEGAKNAAILLKLNPLNIWPLLSTGIMHVYSLLRCLRITCQKTIYVLSSSLFLPRSWTGKNPSSESSHSIDKASSEGSASLVYWIKFCTVKTVPP